MEDFAELEVSLESGLEAGLESGQEAIEQTTGILFSLWEKLVAFFPTLLVALVVFFLGMLIAKLIAHLVGRTMRTAKFNAAASGFGQSLVRIMIMTLLVIICLSILGVPTASIITVVGAAGVAIGLALQSSLSDLAGGFIIMFAKPFQAGDYIIAGGQEGFVESVSILYTHLMTVDNRSIYLPNNIVAGGAVVNLSQKGILRISVPVSVSYDTDLDLARRVLIDAVKQQKLILCEPAPTVLVKELADSGIVLHVSVWVKKTNYFIAPSAVMECAKKAFEKAGISIPFPQVDVHQIREQRKA